MMNFSRQSFFSLRHFTSLLLIFQILLNPLGTLAASAQDISQKSQSIGQLQISDDISQVKLAQATQSTTPADQKQQPGTIKLQRSIIQSRRSTANKPPGVLPAVTNETVWQGENVDFNLAFTCQVSPCSNPVTVSVSGLSSGPGPVNYPSSVSLDQFFDVLIGTSGASPSDYSLTVTGCAAQGGCSNDNLSFTVSPPPVLSISPASQSVTQGNAASYTVSVNTNSYPDNINVSVTAPSDVSISPNSFTLSSTQTSRVVTVTTTTGTSVGTKTINVSGSGSFNQLNSFAKVTGATGTLNVQSAAPPTITINPAPGSSSTATANPGTTAAYNLQLNIPTSYLGSLTMAVDQTSGTSPELSGATYNFNPTTVSLNASTTTLNATLSTSTPPSSSAYKIRVKATPTPGSPPLATNPTFDVSLNVNQVDNAGFVSQSVPTSLVTGQTIPVQVVMQNTGNTSWNTVAGGGTGNYALSTINQIDNTTWGFSRIALPGSIAPGQNATFNFNITAPTIPGVYPLQLQMLKEGIYRFGAATTNSPITVAAPPQPIVRIIDNATGNAITTKTVKVGEKIDLRTELVQLG